MTKQNTNTKLVEQVINVQHDEQELNSLASMSSKIRYLNSKGMSRSLIAKTLDIRYQWVRNVLVTPIKKT